jgi:Ca2+-binding EF-hand superfamily protein
MEELKEAFNLFDAENLGKIGTKHLVSTMKSLGFDTKSPLVFNMITELDNDKYENGITFDQFISEISAKLGDRSTKEGLMRLFKLFDSDNSGSINPQNLKKVVKELGDSMTNDEIKDLIEHASSNGECITFDDFYQIMTKKAFT